MDKTEKNKMHTKNSLSYEITYSYNDKRLSNVSKPRKDSLDDKLKENRQLLEKIYENKVEVNYEEKLNWQNQNCTIQKVFLSDDGSQTITIDTPTLGKNSKISFNVKDGGVWRNF